MDEKPPKYSEDPNSQAQMSPSAPSYPPTAYYPPPPGGVFHQQPLPGYHQQPSAGMQQPPAGYQQPPPAININNVQYQQPLQTGYPPPPQHQVATTTVVTKPNNHSSIPKLPMCLAVVLLIVNIFLPGIGTIIAGFSVFCCGNIGESGSSKLGIFCINFWVRLAQLCTVPIFLIGWIWSIMWGVAFITNAGAAESQTTTFTTVR